MADRPVIFGGEYLDQTYSEFQEEMAIFNRAFLEVLSEGDAKGRVFTFPIPTYNITKDFPWDDPALDVLWRVTARYGIPYFSNFVNSDMSPEDTRSDVLQAPARPSGSARQHSLEKRGGGLFGANPLTGSIGVVTINMPRLGYLAADEGEFLQQARGADGPRSRFPGDQEEGAGAIHRDQSLPLHDATTCAACGNGSASTGRTTFPRLAWSG